MRHFISTRIAGICALFLLASALCSLPARAEESIPMEHFAALPAFSQVKLSPSGEDIGYLTEINGRRHLVLQKLDASEQQVIPPSDEADITNFYWATDERVLVVYAIALTKKYADESTQLVGINRTTKTDAKSLNVRPLVLPSGEPPRYTNVRQLVDQDQIVSLLPDDPDHILLAVDADGNRDTEVRRINIHTGKYREVEPRLRAQKWLADGNGVPRFAHGHNSAGDHVVWFKNSEDKWTNLSKTDWLKDASPVALAEDSDYLYAFDTSEHGTQNVVLINLVSGKVVKEVFKHETVDVSALLLDFVTGIPVGVSYSVHRQEEEYFDPEMRRIQASIDKALPDTSNYINSKARTKPIYLIFSHNDRDPGLYYWYDTEAKRLYVIAQTYASIDPERMARVQPVSIPARDKVQIPAYLTLPPGTEDSKSLPTIILPHGGPHLRDYARWDFMGQFLASRGYAVLQPNFRGSAGYGHKYERAGYNQWGGTMQHDVTDATRWMIAQGIADPKRICIAGYSYGGYAAMMGAIMQPELYRCALSANGVANIPAHKKRWKSKGFNISNTGLKDHRDKEVSPYHQAHRVNIPVMLMSSTDDGRVLYTQNEKLHKRLLSKGKDSTYRRIDDGGHNIVTSASRRALLGEMEKFFAKHLK